MEKRLEVPDGIGEKMWHTVIRLLAEQEGVEIKYHLISKEDAERTKEETA